MPDHDHDHDESFCQKPLGPWIAGLILTAAMFVCWVIWKREDITSGMEKENQNPAPVVPRAGDPKFPGPVTQAAFQAGGYQPAAITKATPNGGMQLVANPIVTTNSQFQNSLSNTVARIIPSVCDIHARRFVNAPLSDPSIVNKAYENVGAGSFVDPRGYVLTNYHVVKDATDIKVTIYGNTARDIAGDVVAWDPGLDLALIKVRAEGPFPEVTLGNSDLTRIGDYVVAVGSPFGIEQTVTSGIISGIRKSVTIENVRYQNLFQTDAPINHGSSGGPLVNLNGEVIGVNTAIYAPTGVFNGTGFTIPINDCKAFLTQVMHKDFMTLAPGVTVMARPHIDFNNNPNNGFPVRFGLEVMPVNEVVAKHFGIEPWNGVLVNRTIDEFPASLAGIKRGDIIMNINGVAIRSGDDVARTVARFHVGESVDVQILRNGQPSEILVRL